MAHLSLLRRILSPISYEVYNRHTSHETEGYREQSWTRNGDSVAEKASVFMDIGSCFSVRISKAESSQSAEA